MPSTKSPKRGRSKSPSRGARSRSRSRGRSKSPARKPKTESPARKTRAESPARKSRADSPARKSRRESKSPSRRSPSRKVKLVKSDEVAEVKPQEIQTSSLRNSTSDTKSESATTTQTITSTEKTTAILRSSYASPTRQSARIASFNTQSNDKDYTDSGIKSREKTLSQESSKVKKEYAMGGPIATFLMMIIFPIITIALNFACTKKSCSAKNMLDLTLYPRALAGYFDKEALLMFVGFHALLTVLSALPVGEVVSGVALKGGSKLKYRINGFFKLMVCSTIFVCLWYMNHGISVIYEKYYKLMCLSLLHCFILSISLFVKSSRVPKSELAASGNTGCLTHDFVMGREQHPRFGLLDLKLHMVQVGCISWFIMNLAFLAQSYAETNSIDYALLTGVIFQNIYIMDSMYSEEMYLGSVEMVKHGLGFFFVFGSTTMLPFIYSLSNRYLLEHPQDWSCWALMAFVFFYLSGYVIYKGSNTQKDNFRKNPNDPAFADMETIPTSSGRDLLISGWWGLVRHPNYLGDLILAFTWTALCGCGSVLPYFYPVMLLMMLVDRSMQDGQACKQKHGAAWDRYCKRVKYQIIPGVF